jgi:hypothetical protein
MIEPEWYIRLKNERDELAERLDRLDRFLLENERDDDENIDLIYAQGEVMNAYLRILDRRIARWEAEHNEI